MILFAAGLSTQTKSQRKKLKKAGSGRALPDLGQIRHSRLAGQPGVDEAVWARPGHPIRRRSTAVRRRPRLLLHARERARLWLGFCGEWAYRGHRGQVSAGIGRGEVGEDGCRRRSCMQELGLGWEFRRGSVIYDDGDIGSAFSCTRSRARWGLGAAMVLQASREETERERGTVDGNLLLCRWSTVAPTSFGRGFASTSRWSGWGSERERRGGKWEGRGVSRGLPGL
jgi:hypothetical protein